MDAFFFDGATPVNERMLATAGLLSPLDEKILFKELLKINGSGRAYVVMKFRETLDFFFNHHVLQKVGQQRVAEEPPM